jgi:hypothetical protein
MGSLTIQFFHQRFNSSFLAILEIELRTLLLVGKCSSTLATLPAQFKLLLHEGHVVSSEITEVKWVLSLPSRAAPFPKCSSWAHTNQIPVECVFKMQIPPPKFRYSNFGSLRTSLDSSPSFCFEFSFLINSQYIILLGYVGSGTSLQITCFYSINFLCIFFLLPFPECI